MILNPPRPLDTIFVARNGIMLSDAIERLREHSDLSATRKRDLVSALLRVAKLLNRTPESIPADPAWLQPRLAAIAPAAVGISHNSWANILSNAKAALTILGIVARIPRLTDLSPLWKPVWTRVLQSGNLRVSRSLGRFVRCMDNLGIAPGAVDVEAALTYRRALEAAELHDSPEESMYQAMRGWNRAVRELDWWPGKPVILPSRRNTFVLPHVDFPRGLRDDFARFRQRMEAPDLLDPNALTAPLRPATVKHRTDQAWRLASAVVRGGVDITALTDINALLAPATLRRGLEWLLSRQGGVSSHGLSDIGTLIRILVTYVAALPAEQRAETIALSRRLTVASNTGMTERNRTRLAPLQDEDRLAGLIALTSNVSPPPDGLWSYTAVKRHELLLAIKILLFCRIRIKNLARIHLQHNLIRLGDGRMTLRFQAEEVKNRKLLEFQLPPELVRMIDVHLKIRGAILPTGHSDWLFPTKDGTRARDPQNFGAKISRFLLRERGLTMNPHLFRHLSAMLWLRDNPGNYEVPRLILGHKNLSATISAYADFDQSGAVALLGDVLRKAAKV